MDAIGFDGAAKELAGGEDMGLADEIVEIARAHARGEWLMALEGGVGFWLGNCRGRLCEQVIASHGGKDRLKRGMVEALKRESAGACLDAGGSKRSFQ